MWPQRGSLPVCAELLLTTTSHNTRTGHNVLVPNGVGVGGNSALWSTDEAGGWIDKENLYKTTFFLKGKLKMLCFAVLKMSHSYFAVLNGISKFHFNLISKASRNQRSCCFSSHSRHFSVVLFNFKLFFLQTLDASNELAHWICVWSCSLPYVCAFVTGDLSVKSLNIKLRISGISNSLVPLQVWASPSITTSSSQKS